MEVTAGAELGEEAKPPGRVDAGVECGQERVVQHFENFSLGLRPAFLAPAGQLLLVHHLGGEEATVEGLQLGEVDGADVAGAEADSEPEVREAELAGRRLGPDPVDGGPAWVGGGRVGLGGGERAGGGREGGLGAGAGTAVDVGCGGCGGGGGETQALEVVG